MQTVPKNLLVPPSGSNLWLSPKFLSSARGSLQVSNLLKLLNEYLYGCYALWDSWGDYPENMVTAESLNNFIGESIVENFNPLNFLFSDETNQGYIRNVKSLEPTEEQIIKKNIDFYSVNKLLNFFRTKTSGLPQSVNRFGYKFHYHPNQELNNHSALFAYLLDSWNLVFYNPDKWVAYGVDPQRTVEETQQVMKIYKRDGWTRTKLGLLPEELRQGRPAVWAFRANYEQGQKPNLDFQFNYSGWDPPICAICQGQMLPHDTWVSFFYTLLENYYGFPVTTIDCDSEPSAKRYASFCTRWHENLKIEQKYYRETRPLGSDPEERVLQVMNEDIILRDSWDMILTDPEENVENVYTWVGHVRPWATPQQGLEGHAFRQKIRAPGGVWDEYNFVQHIRFYDYNLNKNLIAEKKYIKNIIYPAQGLPPTNKIYYSFFAQFNSRRSYTSQYENLENFLNELFANLKISINQYYVLNLNQTDPDRIRQGWEENNILELNDNIYFNNENQIRMELNLGLQKERVQYLWINEVPGWSKYIFNWPEEPCHHQFVLGTGICVPGPSGFMPAKWMRLNQPTFKILKFYKQGYNFNFWRTDFNVYLNAGFIWD